MLRMYNTVAKPNITWYHVIAFRTIAFGNSVFPGGINQKSQDCLQNRMISKEITGYNTKGSCETIWGNGRNLSGRLFPSTVSKSQVQVKSKVTPALKFLSQLLAGFLDVPIERVAR